MNAIAPVDPVGDGTGVPARYTPKPPLLTAGERWFGWLGKRGRARRRLARACADDGSRPRLVSLENSLRALQGVTGAGAAKARPVAADILLFLCWAAIRGRSVDVARRWLTEIDRFSPNLTARLGLRWELLQLLEPECSHASYQAEAVKLFADSLLHEVRHRTAVTHVIAVLYERSSAARCAVVLGRTHPRLARTELVRVALAVCECPATFPSREEARSWMQRIRVCDLPLPPVVVADAQLIAARAAEWEENWPEMEQLGLAALAAAPKHPAAAYWVVRARLHVPESRPLEGLDEAALWRLPEGARLRRQVQVHAQPTLDAAEPLLPVLQGRHGTCDVRETALNVGLLERALTTDEARARGQLRRCAKLGAAIAGQVGRLPWAELNCALAEILLDRAYGPALQRLESNDLRALPQTAALAHVARLLAGMPPVSDVASGNSAPAVLNRALLMLTGGSLPFRVDKLLPAVAAALESEPLLDRFPAVRTAAHLLQAGLQMFAADETGGARPALDALPVESPEWGPWMHARLRLSGRSVTELEAESDTLVVPDAPTAWFVDAWWRHFSLPGQTRSSAFAAAQAALPTGRARAGLEKLGSLCAGVGAFEAEWLESLAQARAMLGRGLTADALPCLRAMENRLEQAAPLARATWRPLIQYWIAVALAHAGEPGAQPRLEQAAPGPLGLQARAQLALLALQRGDAEAGRRWLAGLPGSFPAALFARALWHAHHHEPAEALRLLDEYAGRFGPEASPYHLAAARLRAAVHERSENRTESARLRERWLAEHPTDEISALRSVRQDLETAYADGDPGPPRDLSVCARRLAGLTASSARRTHYTLMLELLSNVPAASLMALAPRLDRQVPGPDAHTHWRQLLASRLLRTGNPGPARQVLATAGGVPLPPAAARARAILDIWSDLTEIPDPARREETAERLAQHEQALGSLEREDATSRYWRDLAKIGRAACVGAAIAPETWRTLNGSAMAHLPFLFADDPGVRRAAADALRPFMSASPARWKEEPWLLLSALIAWATEQDDVFVEHYATLEPVLDELPVAGRDLWVAAAAARYAKQDWEGILDHFPDCVADMADPLVKLIAELASARQAAADAAKPEKRDQILKRIRSVRNNLQDLLEAVGARTP